MKTDPERTGLEATVRFYDHEDVAAVPATVHWRLDCVTTGEVLQDWTEETPEATYDELGNVIDCWVTVEIDGALNAIQERRNTKEVKAFQVVAAKDTPREYSYVHEYAVKRLPGRG